MKLILTVRSILSIIIISLFDYSARKKMKKSLPWLEKLPTPHPLAHNSVTGSVPAHMPWFWISELMAVVTKTEPSVSGGWTVSYASVVLRISHQFRKREKKSHMIANNCRSYDITYRIWFHSKSMHYLWPWRWSNRSVYQTPDQRIYAIIPTTIVSTGKARVRIRSVGLPGRPFSRKLRPPQRKKI